MGRRVAIAFGAVTCVEKPGWEEDGIIPRVLILQDLFNSEMVDTSDI
jgi:hypothetical protein